MRKVIPFLLVPLTLLFAYLAVSIDPVRGCDRLPTCAGYGFSSFFIWTPYCIICMFLDRNRLLGVLAVVGVMFAIGYFIISMAFLGLGHVILSLIVCVLALPVLWAMSIISRLKKRVRDNQIRDPGDTLCGLPVPDL